MIRYRKTVFAGLCGLGLFASAALARAQSQAPVASQAYQVPAGHTIVADDLPFRVGDLLGHPARQLPPVSRRIFRIVLLVDVIVVAILAAIVVSQPLLVPTPGPTSNCTIGQHQEKAGQDVESREEKQRRHEEAVREAAERMPFD